VTEPRHVVIVGGGFAGIACAKKLASNPDVKITLIDRNNYHQFQPLLYQVATSQLAPGDIAYPLRAVARKHPNFNVLLANVTSVDPVARTVTTETGETYQGDYLVLAAGSQPFFFKTPGAREHAFPLYSLDDAKRLRSRILDLFEEADRDRTVIEQGALNFVVVGGGPTGVEVTGALAEMIHGTLAAEYHDLAVEQAEVTLIDHGHALLSMFAEKSHDYATKVLTKDGVRLRMGTGVTEVGPGHAVLSDGSTIRTRCVIWGGGLKAAEVASSSGLGQGRGGRIDVEADLSVEGFPGVYVIGDVANIPHPGGGTYPQLGSVAMQSGTSAAKSILAEIEGKPRVPFHYLDKGSMAMIGRGAAVASIPLGHHELHGSIAFAAWLGVHAVLMSGVRNRIDAFVNWGWDYFSKARGPQVLDRSDAPRIDWGDDEDLADEPPAATG
jgi:NADH:quinone reductase (non-electrogenic)